MKGTIIVGVTSSVAAYKSVQLVSDLLKKGYDVEVIMTKNATEFITPFMFSSLTKHKTYVETFDKTRQNAYVPFAQPFSFPVSTSFFTLLTVGTSPR